MSPQRSAEPVDPWIVFVVVTTFFFGVVAFRATAPATAAIMSFLSSLESEAFGVDVTAGDAGGAQPREHGLGPAWGAPDGDRAGAANRGEPGGGGGVGRARAPLRA